MSQFTNSYCIVFLFALLLSCSKEEDGAFVQNASINIPNSIIPDSGTVNTDITISVKAQAPNGCYNNLRVNLLDKGSRHYLVYAIADFESHGPCPTVPVSLDTILTFKPTSAGEYFFQINEAPHAIRRDTLVVN